MNTTGFPSPAQDYEKQTFDFNELLIRHPSSTFSMRYEGEDLQEFNIQKGDILIVDCSFRPKKDFFGIVIFDNTFHCVYIQKEQNSSTLYSYYKNRRIIITNIFGIVVSVVRLYDYAC
jgi:DNA polymerase V